MLVAVCMNAVTWLTCPLINVMTLWTLANIFFIEAKIPANPLETGGVGGTKSVPVIAIMEILNCISSGRDFERRKVKLMGMTISAVESKVSQNCNSTSEGSFPEATAALRSACHPSNTCA